MAIAITFGLTVIAWIFFRSESIGAAFEYLRFMFTKSLFSISSIHLGSLVLINSILILILVTIEWMGRTYLFPLEKMKFFPNRVLRWSVYTVLIFLIFILMLTEETPFIYFQF